MSRHERKATFPKRLTTCVIIFASTAFVWPHGWVNSQAIALSRRTFIANCSNGDGFIVTVICAHISHVHTVRQAQWGS